MNVSFGVLEKPKWPFQRLQAAGRTRGSRSWTRNEFPAMSRNIRPGSAQTGPPAVRRNQRLAVANLLPTRAGVLSILKAKGPRLRAFAPMDLSGQLSNLSEPLARLLSIVS